MPCIFLVRRVCPFWPFEGSHCWGSWTIPEAKLFFSFPRNLHANGVHLHQFLWWLCGSGLFTVMKIPKCTDLCRKRDFFPLTICRTRIELISGPSSVARTQFLVSQPSSTFFLVGFLLRQVLYSGMQNRWAGSNLTFFNIKISGQECFPLKSHQLQWYPISISELISVQADWLKIELHALFL